MFWPWGELRKPIERFWRPTLVSTSHQDPGPSRGLGAPGLMGNQRRANGWTSTVLSGRGHPCSPRRVKWTVQGEQRGLCEFARADSRVGCFCDYSFSFLVSSLLRRFTFGQHTPVSGVCGESLDEAVTDLGSDRSPPQRTSKGPSSETGWDAGRQHGKQSNGDAPEEKNEDRGLRHQNRH